MNTLLCSVNSFTVISLQRRMNRISPIFTENSLLPQDNKEKDAFNAVMFDF